MYYYLIDYWGKGIGSTVAKILMDRALSEKSLKKNNAIIDPKNQASRKILTNNGFISEKIVEMDGLPVELFAFSISAKI